MPTTSDYEYITRAEYEKRHEDLQKQIGEIKNNITLLATTISAKMDAIAAKNEAYQDKLETKIGVINEKLGTRATMVWQFIAMTAINLIVSGSIISYLSITGHFK